MSAEQNAFQVVADRTNDLVTPANVIDAVAFVAAIYSGPRLDQPRGVIGMAGSYASDVIDGRIARATGTSSEIGAMADAAGDKLKTAYAGWHIWQKELASRPLLGAVILQNVSNAAATVYDRLANDKPQIELGKDGKYSAFTNSMGVGLQVIGTELSKTNPRAGRAAKITGAVVGYGGLAVWGIKASKQYWQQARA